MTKILWFLPLALCACVPTLARADLDRRIQIAGRGPLHEAYAQPWEANPEPNPVISEQPPEALTEEPPDDRPTGKNVQWIPGYWQWDNEKKDFIWVTGFWRDMPSGRRWVAGVWARTPSGWRWVSGHWAADQERDYQLVEPPPPNPDRGPMTPAPDGDSFYIPGTWFYSESGYAFRNGYWAGCRPGYLWVPARYFWTPIGWGFSSGYWDFAFGARGLLFAPCSFGPRASLFAGFVFRPSFAVSFSVFSASLFVRPSYSHYYFGDYYARTYANAGIYPWVSFASRSYDPVFAHERWANRSNPNWLASQRSTLDGRINGTLAVPPRTLADQTRLSVGSTNPAMLAGLDQLRRSGAPLETISSGQRSQQVQNAQKMTQRSAVLTQTPPRGASASAGQPVTTSFGPGLVSGPLGAGPTISYKPGSGSSGSTSPDGSALNRALSAPSFANPAPAMGSGMRPLPPMGGSSVGRPNVGTPGFNGGGRGGAGNMGGFPGGRPGGGASPVRR